MYPETAKGHNHRISMEDGKFVSDHLCILHCGLCKAYLLYLVLIVVVNSLSSIHLANSIMNTGGGGIKLANVAVLGKILLYSPRIKNQMILVCTQICKPMNPIFRLY